MKIEEHIKNAINTYITMLEYNRGYEHTLHVVEVALERVKTGKHTMYLAEDDLDFYAFLVLLCGDYGTSPRFGWFDDKIKYRIDDYLDVQRLEILRCKELEDGEDANGGSL